MFLFRRALFCSQQNQIENDEKEEEAEEVFNYLPLLNGDIVSMIIPNKMPLRKWEIFCVFR